MANPTTAFGYPLRLPSLSSLLMLILLAVLLTACAVTPEPLTNDELTLQAEEDIDRLFIDTEPLSETEVLTLPRAIARALKYNLDHRVKMMEQALALNRFDVDKFDLLPKLVAQAGYHSRSEYRASRNTLLSGGDRDSEPSYSSERKTTTSELTSSWNILDFGISYYTAQQSADRALIAAERRRKVLHNLIQEIFFSYWRVVAYQQLRDEIRKTVELAETEFSNADAEIQERLTDPLQALRYQKMLLENIRKLENIEQELSSAHIDLAALINVEPGTNIRVATPELGNLQIPEWDMPLDHMEELAFHNNPDIRERSYQSRIAVKETRKAILSMLPGITLTNANKYDSNDLLESNHWYEWSTKLTWNVFNILKAPARIEHAETGEKLTEMQRLALRMAVLAQVHVA
ncbi:MAG: TolC family protein, partial [Gammaproteobacteria bacterium]|nr:TolC family protein [Gammaproteobacteria bacterium]